jgi:hypothetical protein
MLPLCFPSPAEVPLRVGRAAADEPPCQLKASPGKFHRLVGRDLWYSEAPEGRAGALLSLSRSVGMSNGCTPSEGR